MFKNDGNDQAFCFFQIRLDGANSDGDSSSTLSTAPSGTAVVGAYGGYSGVLSNNGVYPTSFSTRGFFTGLAPGFHTFEIGRAPKSTSLCTLNSGIYDIHFVIEEIESLL